MITNINIISGFLGAGKTTFLRKLIPAIEGKKVLIENEYGSAAIDGDLLRDIVPVKELFDGCICCSAVHEFRRAIEALVSEYSPNELFIEPSGVGSLSDILRVCKQVCAESPETIRINKLITIVDINAYEDYTEGFGKFYLDQIENANIILLSHFEAVSSKDIQRVISEIRKVNPKAFILEEDWYYYDGDRIAELLDSLSDIEVGVEEKGASVPANKIFSSISVDNPKEFSRDEIDQALTAIRSGEYGCVLRAKGILKLNTNEFISFNFTPHHQRWEYIEDSRTCKTVFIGVNLITEKIQECFRG